MPPHLHAAATVFGLGTLRPAPGSWGSLAPFPLFLALWIVGVQPASPWWWAACALACVLACVACLGAADHAEARWGKDPGPVVSDEAAGQSITLAFVPAFAGDSFWSIAAWFAVAFVLFRLCDIFKPWPANALQRVPGGWGILLDDLVAGAQAGVILLIAAVLLAR